MIIGALRVTAPHVLDLCLSNGLDDRQLRKSEMLDELLREEGAKSVFELSRYFSLDTSSSSLIYLLLNSSTPQAMIQKLGLYDSHFRISRDLQLKGTSDRHMMVEHFAQADDPPTSADELFLAGALRNLLLLIGCRSLKLEWLSVRSEHLRKELQGLEQSETPIEANTRWRFSWERQQRPENIRGLDDFLISNTAPFIAPYTLSLTQRVEEYLVDDLNTRPTMEEMADKLGISTRSLQRKLQEEGTSYSRVYSELRIKTAARLLRHSNANLTEIGFLSGFSDSAHFSREFKKVQKMSPKAYRDKFQKQDD